MIGLKREGKEKSKMKKVRRVRVRGTVVDDRGDRGWEKS